MEKPLTAAFVFATIRSANFPISDAPSGVPSRCMSSSVPPRSRTALTISVQMPAINPAPLTIADTFFAITHLHDFGLPLTPTNVGAPGKPLFESYAQSGISMAICQAIKNQDG